jgi:DNA end-binding protein Ku
MRSVWTGSINFGLVNIPIKLYTAVRESHLHLNYLRKGDLCPIGYTKVCRKTGEEVKKEDIVRGYEYQKGDFVILDESDFKKADVEKNYAINIEEFVPETDIDIKYAEKPYYLEPEKQGIATYALFREALTHVKKVGIGKFVFKEREHLVMLKAQGSVILLNLLRYQEEVLDISELHLPEKMKVPKNQIDLALELIDKLSGRFHPEKYKDTYTDKLKQIIASKKKGRKVPIKAVRPAHITASNDIVSRLKESLAMAK